MAANLGGGPPLWQKQYLRAYSNQIILASFLLIIFVSTWFLSLSWCSKGVSLFQAFFTATSATCVTGLSVVEMDKFSILGQIVIMLLIQIGGLGLMTLSFFLMVALYRELGVGSTSLAKDFLSLNSFGRIKDYLSLIVKLTVATELLGALVLFTQFSKCYPVPRAGFESLFYAISAFCNAGISLRGDGLALLAGNGVVMFTIQVLVVIGGLGFFVFYELINAIRRFVREYLSDKPMPARSSFLSLHSNIVIKSSFLITVIGTLFLLAVEKKNLFLHDSWVHAFFESLFHNISLRSSGFSIFDIEKLSDASLLFSMFCMLIGASPGSTGGGIKTTTFAIFVATFISIIRGKSNVEIGSRTISEQQIYKSASILALSITWIFSATFLLLLIEKEHQFLPLLFETCSSLSNAGLSTGITPHLSRAGQVILMINMLAGRIGILTFVFAIQQKNELQRYKYPKEEIILG
jgi:trk system potassium uptake protein TrkH